MVLLSGLLAVSLAVSPLPWFKDVTAEAGIPSLRHGEGVNAVDVDRDGLTDLFLPCVRGEGYLLKNLGKGHFTDVTGRAGIQGKGGVGAAIGDLNGDGRPDIYVARGADPYVAPNLLFLQRPDGTFADASTASGVAANKSGLTVTLADFDGNGHLDAFLPAWGLDVLLSNEGEGRFRESGHDAGIRRQGRGWSAVVSDFDGDGALDIFATHGGYTEGPDNRLYHNLGNGRFEDVTLPSGLAESPWSMGAVSADFDGDGDFDLYVGAYNGRGRLYRNDGKNTFTDVTSDSGLSAAKSVGVACGDIDGDLLPDLAVAGFAGGAEIFRNLGGMKFTPLGPKAGLSTVNRNEGLALADFDEDGDLDLYVSNVEGNNRLYLNRLDNPLFLKIRFAGKGPSPVGTVARLHRKGVPLATVELAGAVGMGQGPEEFLFRLPDRGPFDLSLTFPGGRRLELQDVKPGTLSLP